MVLEMINLLGCSKDNFKKLLKIMYYKVFDENGEIFFKYHPPKRTKKIFNKKPIKENPFEVLKNLNLTN